MHSDLRAQLPTSGTYIVAVSGGVDSVVLLDMLIRYSSAKYIVAHLDHGIRPDSNLDALFVADLARSYGVKYVDKRVELGPDASEEAARKARYEFLYACRKEYGAAAIITAHHNDDLIETIIINCIRGTGWRGLCSLASRKTVLRPLLDVDKESIIKYAKQNNLQWREDSTNSDPKYLRNYVRLNIVPRIRSCDGATEMFNRLYQSQLSLCSDISAEFEQLFSVMVRVQTDQLVIDRYALIMMPNQVGLELLQAAAAKLSGQRFERMQAERLLFFSKTAKINKSTRPNKRLLCRTTRTQLIVQLCKT